MQDDRITTIYDEVSGGAELLRWFGCVPTFHDAEVISLTLNRSGSSKLVLHGWLMTNEVDADGYFVLDKHAVVTFELSGIMDLQLEGFSAQNVLGRLILRRAPDRPERRPHMTLSPLREDIEIELEPCYGLSGLIRARSVSISIEPGLPGEKQTVKERREA